VSLFKLNNVVWNAKLKIFKWKPYIL
jgi:hypothetical protein